MSSLFSPARLGPLALRNRLIVAPMCQYSGIDGLTQPWHEQHLGQLAISGAAALTIEATAVSPEGAITQGCLGLWNDRQRDALAQTIARVRSYADLPIGMQLAHAGRKASAQRPWDGGRALTAEQGAWAAVAPSAIAWGEGWPVPAALDDAGMARIVRAFADAAIRADAAKLDFIELHAAHGYLMHAFLSPIANRRRDDYGGALSQRMRFPLAIVDAVRAVWPASKTLGLRINGSDWIEDGWRLDDAIAFGRALLARGVDYLSVSSGGTRAGIAIKLVPGYQVPFATAIRQALGCPVITAGLIADPLQAEAIIRDGHSDFIALARALLDDPRWPQHAAAALSAPIPTPPQYQLAMPGKWPLARAPAATA